MRVNLPNNQTEPLRIKNEDTSATALQPPAASRAPVPAAPRHQRPGQTPIPICRVPLARRRRRPAATSSPNRIKQTLALRRDPRLGFGGLSFTVRLGGYSSTLTSS